MAINIVHEDGYQFRANVSGVTGSGASGVIVSGDPGALGQIPFVALTDEDSDGFATIKTNGTATLSVKGETTVNAAIAVGDILYFDSAATPHKVNKDNTNGVRFGYALEAVASGATDTVLVKIGY